MTGNSPLRLALAVALAAGTSCHPGGGEESQASRAHLGRLSDRRGAVDVLRSGNVDWVHLERGADLFEDDRVRTFKGATAWLRFDEGSNLRVDEESLITLGGGITVERGSVAGQLQAGLKLKTPALEAESVASRDIVFQ
jgi:hypothetical protein